MRRFAGFRLCIATSLARETDAVLSDVWPAGHHSRDAGSERADYSAKLGGITSCAMRRQMTADGHGALLARVCRKLESARRR
ncbi:hypothetical protein C8Q80DRAFT_1134111 [Daedaleopsis nitida]|nr:hypothetical protein C8Q80DRAFT_1134111 [Daedaleopsis nitida]